MDATAILEAAQRLKLGLLAQATDGRYSDKDYKEDLRILSRDERANKMLPSLVRTCRTTDDFRRAMQGEYPHYVERRQYITRELQPVLDYLESVVSGTDSFSDNIDSYELRDVIGRGGFGTVYKYTHRLLDYDFALKVFEPLFVSNEENIEGEKRFFREAKMLFQLNHENIVRIYDIGRIHGKPWIKMEYVDGDTLQSFIAQHGPVSFSRSIKPIAALLNGLNAAHEMGVIHRDLKPSNVMVTRDGKFKIIDFGISAFIENANHSKLTRTGEGIAGGVYSDPALISNPRLKDVRSDIYSVGAIWYYLLTGQAPAGGDVKTTLLRSGNATELESAAVLNCLASNPDDRYRSCKEILAIVRPPIATATLNNAVLPSSLTEITREAIFDYLIERHHEETNAYVFMQSGNFQEPERVFSYSGRRDDVTFLGRLYDLKGSPSADSRLRTFEEEIQRHVVARNDYEYGWVFHDKRLGLDNGDDEVLLKFLCEMFHPLVRSEKSEWEDVLEDINILIKVDGYEIYESEKISGRSVYSYRFV